MAKKAQLALLGSASVVITYPDDGDNVWQYFFAQGYYAPSGLYLRAQLRSTSNSSPSAGNPVSALIEDGDFYWKDDEFFDTGYFEDYAVPNTPPPAGPCWVHVWGYTSGSDNPEAFVAHHTIGVTIIDVFLVMLRMQKKKAKARKK